MPLFRASCWTRCSRISRMALVVCTILASFQLPAQGKERSVEYSTFYRTIQIDGLSIFYREAGPKDAPTLLLLHGLPSSSRMFEPLFARLSDHYHLVAPDYPGFGHSDWPDPKSIRVHVRSHRRSHESPNRSTRAFALHALHAGLRRPRGFSYGPGPSGPARRSDCPGCCRAQRRLGG